MLSERSREAALAAVVIVGAGAGIAWDRLGAPRPVPEETIAAASFAERATFCPPSLQGLGRTLSVAPLGDEASGVAVAQEQPRTLPAGSADVRELGGLAPATVVGYGAPVAASVALDRPQRGASAGASAACVARASSRWYFASGSSAIGFDERLLLFNPFPDEAVVRVTLGTDGGALFKAGLADEAVPAGGFTTIRLNRFVSPEPSLAASVTAVRGRVIAWKSVLAEPRGGSHGLELSLGATAPAESWFFAEGAVGPGVDERVSVLNPGESPTTVTITVTDTQGSTPSGDLVDVPLAPGTVRSFAIEGPAGSSKADAGVAVSVLSSSGRGVVAERRMSFSGDVEGVTSEIGAPRPWTSWLVGPPARSPSVDEIALLNPGAEDATVAIVLLSEDGGEVAPEELSAVAVRAGSRVEVALEDHTKGEPMVARVEASEPVVAERLAFSRGGEPADLLGTPVSAFVAGGTAQD